MRRTEKRLRDVRRAGSEEARRVAKEGVRRLKRFGKRCEELAKRSGKN